MSEARRPLRNGHPARGPGEPRQSFPEQRSLLSGLRRVKTKRVPENRNRLAGQSTLALPRGWKDAPGYRQRLAGSQDRDRRARRGRHGWRRRPAGNRQRAVPRCKRGVGYLPAAPR